MLGLLIRSSCGIRSGSMPGSAVEPTEGGDARERDFFVSYTKTDRSWAEWIAWQLEEAGYTTLLQAWDFVPGSNFLVEMDRAAKLAKRTIAVLSPEYVSAAFTQPEWAHAFGRDPSGEQRTLVPVRVVDFDPSGLLGQVVYLDITGLDEKTARDRLLSGLLKRQKPIEAPRFPGSAHDRSPPGFPGGGRRESNPQASQATEFVLLLAACAALARDVQSHLLTIPERRRRLALVAANRPRLEHYAAGGVYVEINALGNPNTSPLIEAFRRVPPCVSRDHERVP